VPCERFVMHVVIYVRACERFATQQKLMCE
jgi:hypothetical protein